MSKYIGLMENTGEKVCEGDLLLFTKLKAVCRVLSVKNAKFFVICFKGHAIILTSENIKMMMKVSEKEAQMLASVLDYLDVQIYKLKANIGQHLCKPNINIPLKMIK